MKFGDFTDEFHNAQAFVESDSNSAMLVAIVDDKRASIGIEDIDNIEWSEESFSKGKRMIRYYHNTLFCYVIRIYKCYVISSVNRHQTFRRTSFR